MKGKIYISKCPLRLQGVKNSLSVLREPMRETLYRINDRLSLKLRGNNTVIYIDGEAFRSCKRLVLQIPRDEVGRFDEIDSIDEAAEVYAYTIADHVVLRTDGEKPVVENDENFTLLSPEEEFWGHCSNLQTWYEHDYDTRLLKANLAFPLLEALAKAGDARAAMRFKEEIIHRLKSGYRPVIEYLYEEAYLERLTNEELLGGLLVPEEAKILKKMQQRLDIEFKFVPSIKMYIEWPRSRLPVNLDKLRRYRGLKNEDYHVKGIQLFFSEFIKTIDLSKKLKGLKKLTLSTYTGETEDKDKLLKQVIDALSTLKGLNRVYTNSVILRKIKKFDFEIKSR